MLKKGSRREGRLQSQVHNPLKIASLISCSIIISIPVQFELLAVARESSPSKRLSTNAQYFVTAPSVGWECSVHLYCSFHVAQNHQYKRIVKRTGKYNLKREQRERDRYYNDTDDDDKWDRVLLLNMCDEYATAVASICRTHR